MTTVDSQHAEMLQLTRAVTAEFQETTDVRAALGVVVELVGRSLDVQRVFVRLGYDIDTTPPIVVEWTDGDTPSFSDVPRVRPSSRLWEVFEQSARTHRAIACDDVTLDERLMPSDIAGSIRAGIQAVIIFPFRDGDSGFGTLSAHDTTRPRQWSAAQISAIETIGREIASAVKRSRAIELERDLVERMRALDTERSEFVASVSHELRSPLTSILGYLELLQDGELGPLTEDQGSVIGVIERNGRRLLGLIEDLLAVSRVERGSFGVRFAPVDMHALLDAVCQTIAIRIREGGLALTVDLPDEPCHALGDPEQLERVVLNLATNAVKFTPPGGTVDIALRREGALVRVEVTDTGIGVAAADQEHIFERFYRATQDGKKPPSGTGLGLYIVQTVIETHGGSVEFESEPGIGTRVACLLPAARLSADPTPPTWEEPWETG
jgi:two-component system, OmpR family, phosphate regulon sensor histidine kinase PhoR